MKKSQITSKNNLLFCSLAFLFLEGCLLLLVTALENSITIFVAFLGAGWFMWTFVEYVVHRFLMHELIIPGQKDELFNHHEHHQHPGALVVGWKHRLLTGVLGILFLTLAISFQINPFTFFTGFFIGFMLYNLLHYLLHRPLGNIILPQVQRAHILHHTRYPHCGFSFSTIFWDWLFNTLPPREAEVTEQMKKNYFSTYTIVSKPGKIPAG
ncbi:sterol desaturase family protein [Algoriphagus sp. A40]|uniref:sterol desaturase family protein n=1 Tax=Algoriphagus sp. A40 TaxID=1945863 RepID=UPI000984AE5D|nr:sterol desaturase family protein [Algoriphagus sp. A40]OOG72216.1 hypothetical protein B0E43_16440 [Algoriphagus sp. A40]